MAERDGETLPGLHRVLPGQLPAVPHAPALPELEIEAGERATEPVEAEPFEPALQLRSTRPRRAAYKVKWDLESPAFTVGVTDDGTFLTNVSLQFSDLMGNHRLFFRAGSVSDYASYGATYLNLKNRFNWGATAYDYRDYFVQQSTGARLKRRYQETAANVFVHYPFSRYYRMESTVGLMDSSYNRYVGSSPLTGQPLFYQYEDRLATLSLSSSATRHATRASGRSRASVSTSAPGSASNSQGTTKATGSNIAPISERTNS